MTTWEYETARAYTQGDTMATLNDAQRILDQHGDLGWELVSAIPNHSTRMTTRQGMPVAIPELEIFLFFKRPRE